MQQIYYSQVTLENSWAQQKAPLIPIFCRANENYEWRQKKLIGTVPGELSFTSLKFRHSVENFSSSLFVECENFKSSFEFELNFHH